VVRGSCWGNSKPALADQLWRNVTWQGRQLVQDSWNPIATQATAANQMNSVKTYKL
jgi:hypothetical protein